MSEPPEDRLDEARRCLSNILSKEMLDDIDIMSLKNVAIWAFSEVVRMKREREKEE